MSKSRPFYSLFGSASLLGLAFLADHWQTSLKLNFSKTFLAGSMIYRLWVVPASALLVMIAGLMLFCLHQTHGSRLTSLLILLTGVAILIYPSVALTFHLVHFFKISMDYFGSGVFYYAAALLSALGLLGMMQPAAPAADEKTADLKASGVGEKT